MKLKYVKYTIECNLQTKIEDDSLLNTNPLILSDKLLTTCFYFEAAVSPLIIPQISGVLLVLN